MYDSAARKFRSRLLTVADGLDLDENTGLFPLDSEWRKLAFSLSTVFGAPRALLLQVAHPTIAQGVFDHSEFDTNPAKRAVRTFLGVWAVTIGKQSTTLDIASIVYEAHIPIRGTIPGYVRGMPDRKYTAMSPDANLWVWATLVEGILFGLREVRHTIPVDRLERFYEESKTFAAFFNVPSEIIPATLEDFEAYFRRVVETELEVTPAARDVGDALLDGAKFPFTLGGWLYRVGAVETLPPSVTAAFGWRRTRFSKRLYALLRGTMRVPYALLPEFATTAALAWVPNVRRAMLGPGTRPTTPDDAPIDVPKVDRSIQPRL